MSMYTVSQASKALNISESKLRKMIAMGEVEPVRVGSKILFTESYLQEKFNFQRRNQVELNAIVEEVISRISGIELQGGVKILFK